MGGIETRTGLCLSWADFEKPSLAPTTRRCKNKYFPRKIKLGSYRRHSWHNHILGECRTHRPAHQQFLSTNSQGRGIARRGINAIISLVFLHGRLSDKISIAGPEFLPRAYHALGIRQVNQDHLLITSSTFPRRATFSPPPERLPRTPIIHFQISVLVDLSVAFFSDKSPRTPA